MVAQDQQVAGPQFLSTSHAFQASQGVFPWIFACFQPFFELTRLISVMFWRLKGRFSLKLSPASP